MINKEIISDTDSVYNYMDNENYPYDDEAPADAVKFNEENASKWEPAE